MMLSSAQQMLRKSEISDEITSVQVFTVDEKDTSMYYNDFIVTSRNWGLSEYYGHFR